MFILTLIFDFCFLLWCLAVGQNGSEWKGHVIFGWLGAKLL